MLWTTAAQSVSKNITCTSVRIRGAFLFNIGKAAFPNERAKQWIYGRDAAEGKRAEIAEAAARQSLPSQFSDVAGLMRAIGVSHRSSCTETEATTSATLTAFMQRKSM